MEPTEIFDAMPFARHVGVELTAASDGEATGHIDIEAHHSSTPATVVAHGGVSYTLADTVGGAAVISLAETPTPTVDMRIDYLAPATGDRLGASASVVRFGDSVAVVDVSVTDETDDRIAEARGVYKTGGGDGDSAWDDGDLPE